MESFKVVIIGAGLAGSLLANGLKNHGVNVTVYERDVENSKRAGYQIRLGDASMAGMKVCLTDDHLARITGNFGKASRNSGSVAGSTTFNAPSLYSRRFKLLFDLNRLPESWYPRSTVISRVTLRDLLLEPLRSTGCIKYEKAFSRYEIIDAGTSKEKVKVYFADGSTDVCDILVGADGSSSKVNQQVGLRNLVTLAKNWCFVCKGELTEERIQKCPKGLLKGPMAIASKGVTLYYCYYMPSSPQDHSSGDTRTVPNKAWSYYWGLNVPEHMVPYKNVSEVPDLRQFCLDSIKDWAPEFHRMMSPELDSEEPSEMSHVVWRASRNPGLEWRSKLYPSPQGNVEEGHPRVWLMGDAIHAMQPNRGMGGGQAMQDTADMLPCILKLRDRHRANGALSEKEITAAVQEYEGKMIPRTSAWVSKSGGTEYPYLDFDGWQGFALTFLSTFILPIISLVARFL